MTLNRTTGTGTRNLPPHYVQSHANYTLFYKLTSSSYTCFLIYVDELIILVGSENEISLLKTHLHNQFHIKDFRKLKYFLGIEVSQSSRCIFISQRKYDLDILHEFSQLGTSPSTIPMKHYVSSHDTSAPLIDSSIFRKIIGSLIYLIVTRSNIAFSVCHLSQFLASPTISHYNECIKILKCIKNAPSKGILYKRDASLQLDAYCDGDWADYPITQ